MSYGAVPVAWQVFTDLITRAASQYGETVDREAAEGWYLQKFGVEPATNQSSEN